MSNKTYDTLKFLSLVVAPVIVFLSTMLAIWDVPYQTQITASLAAVDVLIGSVVSIVSEGWNNDR